MEAEIIKLLINNGVLKSKEIADKMGRKKVKDIQKHLNNMHKNGIITKSKVNNTICWNIVDDYVNGESFIDKIEENITILDVEKHVLEIEEKNDNRTDNEANKDETIMDLMYTINDNNKDEINFLRKEIQEKNSLIASLQKVITLIVSDKERENIVSKENIEKISPVSTNYKPYNKTFKEVNKQSESTYKIEQSNRFDAFSVLQDDYYKVEENEGEIEEVMSFDSAIKFTNKNKRKPNIITSKSPENNHFTNNKSNRERASIKNNEPLILIAGDSIIKNVTSYQLKKTCKGARIMVRPLNGAKIKNIKNLVIDMLEDVSPKAICVHASSNDIGDGKTVEQINDELENLLMLIQSQGIIPIFSLLTNRKDKYNDKVNVINRKIIELCNQYGAGYIEHNNIKFSHLNTGGLHIAREHTHVLEENFTRFFNYLIENDFCLQ